MGNIYATKTTKKVERDMIIYSNDEQYIGERKGEVREGKGEYIYANGDRYEGEWRANAKHGFGYFFYRNGELYFGLWEANKKNGKGWYFYNTGDRYEGYWKDNKKHGLGILYSASGSYFKGIFNMNMREGTGYRYHRNGKVFEETWKENQLINKRLIQEKQEYQAPRRTQAQRTQRQNKKIQHLAKKLKLKQWTVTDVGNFLTAIGLEKYVKNFKDNHINGANLKELSLNDLKEDLGIKEQSDIKLLLKRLAELYKIMPENNMKNIQKLLESYEPKNQKAGELTPIAAKTDAAKRTTVLHANEKGFLMESQEGGNSVRLPPVSKWEESVDNADNREKKKKDSKDNAAESSSSSSSSSSGSSLSDSGGSEAENGKKEAAAKEKKKKEFLVVSSSNFESKSQDIKLSKPIKLVLRI